MLANLLNEKMEKSVLLTKIVKLSIRKFSTSSVLKGKKNFKSFPLYNFRGTRDFKKRQETNPDPDIPRYTYGVREPGLYVNNKLEVIPEMIPELIVPDLTDFTLKPYVSYKASEVVQDEFTAKDLFDAVYSKKIQEDFKKGQLDEAGNSKNPNVYEKLTPEEATQQARKTGSDLF